MTLFKRVFESHFSEEDQPASGTPALLDSEFTPAERDIEDVALDQHQVAKEDPLEDDAVAILSRLETLSAVPEHLAPPVPQEQVEPEPQISMAARAAEAHAQMNGAQLQHSAPQIQQDDAANASQHLDRVAEPPEAAQRGRGRVKTRLLGFHQAAGISADPFQDPQKDAPDQSGLFPTGWLVVVDGPGTGNALPIYEGVSTLGRGDDQALKLDFGDTSISRQNHAAVAYDGEQNKFFLGHGGKSNIIRLNDKPVLSTEDLNHADILRIGETTLRFVALCGPDFDWAGSKTNGA